MPSATDPKIDSFNSPHTIYFNPSARSRHELLVFLPGTNGKTLGTKLFCATAADFGYHVISLMYPDDIAATVCWTDEDPDAFTKFRMALIAGGASPHVTISRANSIENRLVKLLQYLKTSRPGEDWGQFVSSSDDPDKAEPVWEKLALAGQSQGGGHAALIACRHSVARVLMFSSPKDWSRHFDRPASWYSPSKTPASRYFAFVHEQDRQGCSFAQQMTIVKAMGLTAIAEPQDIDKVDLSAPFGGKSHVLTTNYPGTTVTSMAAHATEVTDGGTPKNPDGEPRFKPIWVYMLTSN